MTIANILLSGFILSLAGGMLVYAIVTSIEAEHEEGRKAGLVVLEYSKKGSVLPWFVLVGLVILLAWGGL